MFLTRSANGELGFLARKRLASSLTSSENPIVHSALMRVTMRAFASLPFGKRRALWRPQHQLLGASGRSLGRVVRTPDEVRDALAKVLRMRVARRAMFVTLSA